MNKKYGLWFEYCLIRIYAVDSSINLLILQNKLSIKVPFKEEFVGNVIFWEETKSC